MQQIRHYYIFLATELEIGLNAYKATLFCCIHPLILRFCRVFQKKKRHNVYSTTTVGLGHRSKCSERNCLRAKNQCLNMTNMANMVPITDISLATFLGFFWTDKVPEQFANKTQLGEFEHCPDCVSFSLLFVDKVSNVCDKVGCALYVVF